MQWSSAQKRKPSRRHRLDSSTLDSLTRLSDPQARSLVHSFFNPRPTMKCCQFSLLLSVLASTGAISSLDFIRSSTESPHFYDASGRVRIFHGANRVAKSAPWFFPDMLSDGEADAMADLGFNVVRLGWMWSGFNNAGPGIFNETYFERQQAVVQKLASRGIHTLLDMHEDVLSSKFCLYDGAPLWVMNKSIPRHAFPWPLQGNCSSRGWMSNTLTEAAGQAYQDLYDNTGGMLDDLAAFWARSARVWRDEPAIIGYEVMNEPFAGDVFKDPLLFLPGVGEFFECRALSTAPPPP